MSLHLAVRVRTISFRTIVIESDGNIKRGLLLMEEPSKYQGTKNR
jgi:hypothetical protein